MGQPSAQSSDDQRPSLTWPAADNPPPSSDAALQHALEEVKSRDTRIHKLEAEVSWYRTWADTYWQQLQHLSAAAAALNQQHMLALSNQNQQMAALAQYQLHVQAAAQLVKTAGGTLPGMQGASAAATAGGPFGTASAPQDLAVPTASDVSGT